MTKITVICGPTASGKTAAAVKMALEADGEVISADSMQIYRGMDIGTAKATKDEMQGVPHHLIDIISPDEAYNVALFAGQAAVLIDEITARGKLPIICGGTGFYVNALLFGTEFGGGSDRDEALRAELSRRTPTDLHVMLAKVDPSSAANIPMGNVKRVIRALEYFRIHGKTISAHNAAQRQGRALAYDAQITIMESDRAQLYERINSRVDDMLAAGLVEEVDGLMKAGYSADLTSMQGIGYKEIAKYLQGEYSLAAAAEAVKQATRRFAKRQVTWFKHQM